MLTQRRPRAIYTLILSASLLTLQWPGDQCAVSPYSDAARLSEKFPLITV